MLYLCSMEINKEEKKYLCPTCGIELCRECERKNSRQDTGKVLGKGLIDIGKYVITAVIIATFLGGMEQMWKIYVGGGIIALVAIVGGIYFMNIKK